MKEGKVSAIILAAGKGMRMNSKVPKQYINILGRPVLAYSIEAFEKSNVDDIILVVGENEVEFCRTEIVEKYNFKKVSNVIVGGEERYLSVYNGLSSMGDGNVEYVLIHDGARPLIHTALIDELIIKIKSHPACILGVPTKDTIKVVADNHKVINSPDRRYMYSIQTPQGFSYKLLKNAYDNMLSKNSVTVTDDAMVIETYTKVPVEVLEGSYRNIKITTEDDVEIAELLLGKYTRKNEKN